MPEDEETVEDTVEEVTTPVEVADTPPTPEESTTTVDYESTIAALSGSISERDARINELASQLATAQNVNASLLRQIGSTAAPDAHAEVDRTRLTINDVLYGTDN